VKKISREEPQWTLVQKLKRALVLKTKNCKKLGQITKDEALLKRTAELREEKKKPHDGARQVRGDPCSQGTTDTKTQPTSQCSRGISTMRRDNSWKREVENFLESLS